MKKNFIFAVITAAVMMSLSACVEKLEPEVLPEVIESEVTGRGMDAITATSSDKDGVKTQELSYRSWIKVKGQTKASFDNTVEIKLTNTLVDSDTTTFYRTDTTIVWGNLDPEGYVTRTDYRVRGTRTEGFVTITDSVLVYTIDYGGFSFNYELDYEVAVYDDGITREVMPYHRIESIVDKGAAFSRLETTDDGKYVYARKRLDHTIAAECNGKTYEVKANVTLCKFVCYASQPYVKRSQILDSYCFSLGDETVMSFVEVNRTWSDGREETVKLEKRLRAAVEGGYLGGTKVVRGYSDPLCVVSASLKEDRADITSYGEKDYVPVERVKYNWNIQYNYFDVNIDLYNDVAYYDDYYSYLKFPSYEFSDITTLTPDVKLIESGSDEHGAYDDYVVHQTITAKFGDMDYESTLTFDMLTYK